MKAIIVYRENTEYERDVISWLREFEYRTHKKIEHVNPDTRDGTAFCSVYDIVEYPTVVALDDSGKMQSMWRGLPLPLIDEVSYYV
ncbi:hypothetical protein HY312_03170 [Candidatus Saccharibacteria bacterium]|nr:hypothetical protein [Candidatus Saccharibacteria bacterium]